MAYICIPVIWEAEEKGTQVHRESGQLSEILSQNFKVKRGPGHR